MTHIPLVQVAAEIGLGQDGIPPASQLYRPDDCSFTWRAAVLGSLCGSVIAVSNMYLGLKTGACRGDVRMA
jgi:hypothetical protein